MKHIFIGSRLIGAIALLALAVGCGTMQTQTQTKENLLIAAGFKVLVPKTAAQQQLLQKLPADPFNICFSLRGNGARICVC